MGEVVQRSLTVMPEGRVAEIVGKAGCIDDVRVAAEGPAQLAADLGHLEAVGEAGADKVVRVGCNHLGLRPKPA